jgi:hypothetical protein
VKRLVLPAHEDGHFRVLIGENGCGKSTAVKEEAKKLEFKGIIYICAPGEADVNDFVLLLGKKFKMFHLTNPYMRRAVEWHPLSPIWLYLPGYGQHEILPSILRYIRAVAETYRKDNEGIVPVLVIDQVNNFCATEKGRSYLRRLQAEAKEWADNGIMRVIFISSEGEALSEMSKSSNMSRADISELRDISDEQAIEFVQIRQHNLYQENKDFVEEIVRDYVGGRMKGLVKLAQCDSKEELETFKSMAEKSAEMTFGSFKVTLSAEKLGGLSETEKKKIEVLKAIAIELAKAEGESLPAREIIELLGDIKEQELRQVNLFSYHVDETYTFQNRALRTVARKNLL